MLGVLVCEECVLNAFSGLAGGKSMVEGFVPPIFDHTDPDGHFRTREREISAITAELEAYPSRELLVLKRKAMSADLQDWLFSRYVVRNALGECRTVLEIFKELGIMPPGGTGDCAAPKLLQYAYSKGMHPLAMGEFWYGASPGREPRQHGRFYPACTGKCGPLLGFMLEGLEVEDSFREDAAALCGYGLDPSAIVYSDDDIVVVDKPSGMLSAPGRKEGISSMEELLRNFFATDEIYSCHRLDMDTSGLMVFARSLRVQAELRMQFERRQVVKRYKALLSPPGEGSRPLKDGDRGEIELPIGPDWNARPRQMVDYEAGKPAHSSFEVIAILPDGCAEVVMTPHTGRTHQLRVHAAHVKGLGRPIVGDPLYGAPDASRRLCLRASYLSFRHPSTGEMVEFSAPWL